MHYSMVYGVEEGADVHGNDDRLVSFPKMAVSYYGSYPACDVASIGLRFETIGAYRGSGCSALSHVISVATLVPSSC